MLVPSTAPPAPVAPLIPTEPMSPASEATNGDRLDGKIREIVKLREQLDAARDRDAHRPIPSVTDGLTGLHTHSVLKELLDQEIQAARRTNQPVALIFADIDHFSRINTRHSPS